jgi:ribosomal protein S27E
LEGVEMEEKYKEPSELVKARVVVCPKCGNYGAVQLVYKDGKVEVQCTYCEPEKYL